MSIKIKHTPGPWEYSLNEYFDISSEGKLIARVGGSIYLSINQQLADAKLITAAPILLEALIILFEHAKTMLIQNHPHLQLAEKAIKKATEL
jgi:hypothetical protein